MKALKKRAGNYRERVEALDYALLVIMGLIAFVCLFPFYQTLLISLSSLKAYSSHPLYLLPYSFDTTAFKVVFSDKQFWAALWVTLLNTVVGTFCCIAVNVLGAYVLSKTRLVGVKLFSLLATFFMMVSAPLIPHYLNIQELGLYDNLLVYLFPSLVTFYYMFQMRNFFLNIPGELLEAARIDGANEARILTSVVLPVAKPFIMTFALFIGVGRWNEWYTANIYIRSPAKFTLQYYLRTTLASLNASLGEIAQQMMQQGLHMDVAHDAALRSASIMLAALPIMCLYPFVQRYLIKGMTMGAIKG